MTISATAAWLVADPASAVEMRWWDGARWADNVSPSRVQSASPLSG
jgi:hypothetical protein